LQHAKFIPVTVRACRQTLTVHAPMLRDELLTLWEDGLYTAALCPTSDIIEAYKGVRHRLTETPVAHGGVRHLSEPDTRRLAPGYPRPPRPWSLAPGLRRVLSCGKGGGFSRVFWANSLKKALSFCPLANFALRVARG